LSDVNNRMRQCGASWTVPVPLYDRPVLAYVFWHVPAADAAGYEDRLAAFHSALRAGEPAWLGPTATLGLPSVPWLGGAAGYEDWYLVEDFAALGALNAEAVSGARKPPHDAAAAAARAGVAGVMGHVAGPLLPAAPAWGGWLGKPPGLAYDAFHAELAAALPPGACAWQRQMTLGPATEYCLLAEAELAPPWPLEHAWPLRAVVS
jgi:hypothetical protein